MTGGEVAATHFQSIAREYVVLNGGPQVTRHALCHRCATPMTEPHYLLVADDDPGHRESVLMALEATGYRVRAAASGAEALEIARHHAIDCAILDFRMGDMTGLDVIRNLRAEKWVGTGILVTAELERTLQTQAHLAGFTACLRKPVTPDALRAAVASALGNQQAHGSR